MKKRDLTIPERYNARFRAMWQDGEGFWASAAPGYCFDAPDGYTLRADTEADLVAQALERVRPEEYEVRDMTGERLNTISYGQACRLLPNLRLGYSIVSASTGKNFEHIQPAVYRRHQAFSTLEQEDGTTIYSLPEYSLTVRREEKDGHISLIPVDGAVAAIRKIWEELPEAGLNAACLSLEQQIDREARQQQSGTTPLLRVTGDRDDPLMSALLALLAVDAKKLDGLIEVIPFDGYELSIEEVALHRPPYLKAANDISQLLQNNGYEDASKFLDCAYEL